MCSLGTTQTYTQGGNKTMTSANYMQRFVSESVINEYLEAHDTMQRTLSTDWKAYDAAGYKFYNMHREVITAIRDSYDDSLAYNGLDRLSDEHQVVILKMMTRLIQNGSLQLNTAA